MPTQGDSAGPDGLRSGRRGTQRIQLHRVVLQQEDSLDLPMRRVNQVKGSAWENVHKGPSDHLGSLGSLSLGGRLGNVPHLHAVWLSVKNFTYKERSEHWIVVEYGLFKSKKPGHRGWI